MKHGRLTRTAALTALVALPTALGLVGVSAASAAPRHSAVKQVSMKAAPSALTVSARDAAIRSTRRWS